MVQTDQSMGPTAPEGTAEGALRGWRDPVSICCLATAACGVLGLLGTAWLIPPAAPAATGQRLALVAVLIAELAGLQVIPIRLTHAGEGEELALEEAFLIPMALLMGPFGTALALGFTTAFGQLYQRASLRKALFNVGQATASAAVGLGIFEALRGGASPASARALAAAAGGGLAYALVSTIAVAGIISLARGASFRRTLVEGAGLRAATWAGSISFGVMVVAATARFPWAALLTIAPIIALQVGYGSAVEQRRERRRSEELYRAASTVRAGMDEDEILGRLRSSSVWLLDADEARFVDPGSPHRSGALRIDVEAGILIEVARTAGDRPWTDRDRQLIQTLVGVAATALERAKLFAEAKHQALYDSLTGLPNQVLIEDRVTQAIAVATRKGTGLALLFLDLDNFKRVNDTLGHGAGNELLQAASDRLAHAMRASDTVARMGGDEFVVLMPSVEGALDACAVGEKILDAFREPFELPGNRIFCSASIGISLYPDHGTHYAGLLQKSDLALYEAKAGGRGTYRVYRPSMSTLTEARAALEADLRNALEREELRLLYQPQINLSSGAMVGAEALVRWQHPTQGMLEPNRFIPMAEDVGLIRRVDAWVLRSVCAQALTWRAAGLPALQFAINLSGHDLGVQNLAETVLETLGDHDIPTSQLELEVTESIAIQEGGQSLLALQELRDHGIGVAIDDFGTGYSSLSRLSSFPVNALKIDKSFTDTIGTTSPEAPLVVAIIAMAHSLNLEVVAEGVERIEQLYFLRDHGCDRAQGFLLGRPVPASQLERLFGQS